MSVVHHDKVYGMAYGSWPWVYRCASCGDYVGMHPFTAVPLGTLAGAELRRARKECKAPFQALWEGGSMTRSGAYSSLASHLGIPVEQCHFGWFDLDQCRRAKAWAENLGCVAGQP